MTKALKDMILDALDGAGGVAYLKQQAADNPGPFLALVGKVLPLQIAGDKENPLNVITEIRETIIDPGHSGSESSEAAPKPGQV